jgi:hypothetical protein
VGKNIMTRTVLILVSTGCAIITLGAYVAGGTDVTCTRVDGSTPVLETGAAVDRRPAVAACVVRTKRWLGRRSTAEQTYARVTDADRLAGRSIFQLIADGTPVAEIGGTRNDAAVAAGRLKEWFDGDALTPITIDFSEWGFAYAAMGFGALWLGVTALMARGRAEARTDMRPS